MLTLGIILVAGILFAASLVNGGTYVPKQFSDARAEAAQTADGIVSMSNDSIANLTKISELDKAGKYNQALDLVTQEKYRNDELGNRAEILLRGLSLMTQALSQIKPQSAAEVGIQAIGKEYQINLKLVDYANSTYGLLNVLDGVNSAPESVESQQEINSFISQMNVDASAVNTLNEEYKGLMAQFDALTK
jgi:hypothetical protein